MKALAVLAFFLGILAVLNWRSAGPESEPRAAAGAVSAALTGGVYGGYFLLCHRCSVKIVKE